MHDSQLKLFGDKDHFAIEVMIEPDLVAPSMAWGRMRIWCGGVAFGNLQDQYCGLDHTFSKLSELANDIDALWCDEFTTMQSRELVDYLEECLFGSHGNIDLPNERTADEIRADWQRYGNLSFLTNWGEQFDACGKPFIVSPPGEDIKILRCDFPAEAAHGVSCSRSAFCRSVDAAVAWFNLQRDTLAGGELR